MQVKFKQQKKVTHKLTQVKQKEEVPKGMKEMKQKEGNDERNSGLEANSSGK